MGYSVRTDGWRYTEWVAWNQTSLAPIWSDVVARELYVSQLSLCDLPEPIFNTNCWYINLVSLVYVTYLSHT
jgi:hypothetical protein